MTSRKPSQCIAVVYLPVTVSEVVLEFHRGRYPTVVVALSTEADYSSYTWYLHIICTVGSTYRGGPGSFGHAAFWDVLFAYLAWGSTRDAANNDLLH